jgi:hypothetical protein
VAFATMLVVLSFGCQSGELLLVKDTEQLLVGNMAPDSYEVFWLEPTPLLQGTECTRFSTKTDSKIAYFSRVADESDAGRLDLPSDFASNGLEILAQAQRPLRVMVVLFRGKQVVAIADSVTPIEFQSNRVRSHSLLILKTDGNALYRESTGATKADFPGALQWKTSSGDVRIPWNSNSRDFDDDGSNAMDNCNGQPKAGDDCNDDDSDVYFRDTDTTCGLREPDVNCRLDVNQLFDTLCGARGPTTCTYGFGNCNDDKPGNCKEVSSSGIKFADAWCDMPEVTNHRCRIQQTPEPLDIPFTLLAQTGMCTTAMFPDPSTPDAGRDIKLFAGTQAQVEIKHDGKANDGICDYHLSLHSISDQDGVIYIAIKKLNQSVLHKVTLVSDELVSGIECN